MRMPCNKMFKTVDTRQNNKMVGFVEVSALDGLRYGMGPGVPERERRPVVANLAVSPRVRRCGIGSSLMEACEEAARSWGHTELTLQVEEDNYVARDFYHRLGFVALFVDRTARRYDTSGFLLQNVRCAKMTLRKVLDAHEPLAAEASGSFGGRSGDCGEGGSGGGGGRNFIRGSSGSASGRAGRVEGGNRRLPGVFSRVFSWL
ncbi:unnamed protein product [Phaeothamnion confervicola]